jgi:hypothetical protein
MKTLRNETDRKELIERLEALRPDAQPLWGRMNLEQMLSHLVQSGEMPFVESAPDRSTPVSRSLFKVLSLYFLPIPKNIKTSPELDQQQQGRPPVGLEADKANVIASIELVGTMDVRGEYLAHPFFGKLSSVEWGRLGYKHIDHHLRQFGA